MKTSEVIQAWKSVLSGRRPSLAIEITRECPLRCPGCYAFEDGHVGGLNLRQLQDKRGEDLVQGVLALGVTAGDIYWASNSISRNLQRKKRAA